MKQAKFSQIHLMCGKRHCSAPDTFQWIDFLLMLCRQGACRWAVGALFSVMKLQWRAFLDALSCFPCTSQSNRRISLSHCNGTVAYNINKKTNGAIDNTSIGLLAWWCLQSPCISLRLHSDLPASYCSLGGISMTSLLWSFRQKAKPVSWEMCGNFPLQTLNELKLAGAERW